MSNFFEHLTFTPGVEKLLCPSYLVIIKTTQKIKFKPCQNPKEKEEREKKKKKFVKFRSFKPLGVEPNTIYTGIHLKILSSVSFLLIKLRR